MHYLEWSILAASWIISVGLLIHLVPVAKYSDAFIIYFFSQTVTWLVGLVVVEVRWIEYPVRILQSNRTSAAFEYQALPVICILFNLYYPVHKSKQVQWLYYLVFTSVLTILEVIMEKYTELITYTGWTWYWTFLTVMAAFYLTRKYYLWFVNKPMGAK